MRLTLEKPGQRPRDITGLLSAWTWSGDKAAISRELEGELLDDRAHGLPLPEIGDRITMEEGGEPLFSGRVLLREQASGDSLLHWAAYDQGYLLARNQGTYKFSGATPEQITRTVCRARGLPVAELPVTGVGIARKFAGVALDQLLATVWTLAAERTGRAYALRWTPAGLTVRVRSVKSANLVIRPRSNLMEARTREDATRAVNAVAIYDRQGNLLRRSEDRAGQQLVGVMERHITEAKNGAAKADRQARRLLEEGAVRQTVTVDLLGDLSLITGETVEVRDPETGLDGIFWIESDVHTWKRGQYVTKLTLNCKNVMHKADAGGELK